MPPLLMPKREVTRFLERIGEHEKALSLRAAKQKYLDSLSTTTVDHDFPVWCGRLGISTFRSDTGRAEVGSVKRCSKAESYGMQVGDTILELDGQRVDHDAFRAGLAAARRKKRTVRLLIARGG